MRLYHHTHQGFTLIELVIAITIFTFLLAIGVATYIQLSGTMKRENIQRRLYSEMERVLSDINRWGKFYAIDYTWYVPPHDVISPEQGNRELVLISKDQQSRISIAKIEGTDMLGVYREKKEGNQFVPENGFSYQTYLPLTSENLHIQQASFFIFPGSGMSDPEAFQQKITTVFEGYMDSPFNMSKEEFTLQTTFSSRLYAPTL